MQICFILPRYVRHPIGGYKIVFEYANRLVKDPNHNVSILYLNDDALVKKHLPVFLKNKIINRLTNHGPNWFDLDKKIKNISLTQKNWRKKINKVDTVIATAATTVNYTDYLFPNTQKFYLIQGFEDWNISKKELYKTYNWSNFTNITISKWLYDIVNKNSTNPTYYIQNPIDIDSYKVYNPINRRMPHTIGLLYHEAPLKGSKYALSVINKLKIKYPDLKVKMFGTYARPQSLPNWIEYSENASKKKTIEIYNSVSVFLNASIKEGFGLTGLEAMACGAALVSTDYLGVREYAKNNFNAKLSPVKDVNDLVKQVSFLFENDNQRIELARQGTMTVRQFSWDNAYKKMISILSQEQNI